MTFVFGKQVMENEPGFLLNAEKMSGDIELFTWETS